MDEMVQSGRGQTSLHKIEQWGLTTSHRTHRAVPQWALRKPYLYLEPIIGHVVHPCLGLQVEIIEDTMDNRGFGGPPSVTPLGYGHYTGQ